MRSLADVKIPRLHAVLLLPSVSPTEAQPSSSSLDFALVKTLERKTGVRLESL